MNAVTLKRGFLSYSHKDKEIADYIDQIFQNNDYIIQRDERDAPNRTNIYSFMEIIKQSPFVVIIYSMNYVKSSGAMFEAMEFMQSSPYDFFDKATFILVDSELTDNRTIVNITNYWIDKISNPLPEKFQSQSFKNRWETDERIAKGINNFMSQAISRKTNYSLDSIKRDNGVHLLNRIVDFQIQGEGKGRAPIGTTLEYLIQSADIETLIIDSDKLLQYNPDQKEIYFIKANRFFILNKYRLVLHTLQQLMDQCTNFSGEEYQEMITLKKKCLELEYLKS